MCKLILAQQTTSSASLLIILYNSFLTPSKLLHHVLSLVPFFELEILTVVTHQQKDTGRSKKQIKK